MKRVLRVLVVLMVAVAALLAISTLALAEDKTFTVRVYGGNQGTIGGQTVQIVEFPQGSEVNLESVFGTPDIKDPSKYYFKYYRVADKDNNDSLNTYGEHAPQAVVTIDKDSDFIATYGSVGDMKTITITYAVRGGDQVLGNDTVEGKVGDRIVKGYRYFEGYRPLHRNIIGTVKEDDADNVWRLEYVPVSNEGSGSGSGAEEQVSDGGSVQPSSRNRAQGPTDVRMSATPDDILDVDDPLRESNAKSVDGGGESGGNEPALADRIIQGAAEKPLMTAGIVALLYGMVIAVMGALERDQW